MTQLKLVSIGSKWTSSDSKFKLSVRDIDVREDGTWVIYGRHGEDTSYECLIDAFLNRFTKEEA
jgi:hypothetical protein